VNAKLIKVSNSFVIVNEISNYVPDSSGHVFSRLSSLFHMSCQAFFMSTPLIPSYLHTPWHIWLV
jgi:hypothetical protein